jgi:glutamine amidotransferase
MCRLFAYVGPAVPLSALLYAPPHGLERQAHKPRHQLPGRINADGWGVAWYDGAAGEIPARYRTATPIWADESFRGIADHIRAAHVVAAVRNASPGAPVEDSGASPFVGDSYAFTHNGYVEEFRGALGVELHRDLTVRRAAGVRGGADSEVVFAMILDCLDQGASMADALLAVLSRLLELSDGKFNLLISDGHEIVATRYRNSLFTLDRGDDGRIVASEPFDDADDWSEVPERSLVTMTATSLKVEPF